MMKKKVMIFDDDADILELCSILLKSRGCIVHTRGHCRDIISTVSELEPHIIFMDNKIPDMGGIAASQLLKSDEKLKKIPLIFFSANTNVEQLSREAMADDYLKKPFNISELEEMVEKYSIKEDA